MIRRYIATGRGEPFAILAVLGAALAGGLALGIVEGLIERWFSLLILFPLLIGATAGGLAVLMIGRFRLRAPLLAFALAAAGGAAGYAATHVIGYLQFRSTVATQIRTQAPTATDDEIAKLLDAHLTSETGASGFRGYLELAAKYGVSIKRAGDSRDDGLKLTGIGAWLVWLFELALAAGIAGFVARGRARAPFCETCNAWFGDERTVGAGSDGSKAARTQLMAALDAHDLDGAARVIAAPPGPTSHFVVTSASCPHCGTEAFCTLKRLTFKKRREPGTSDVETWLMTHDELASFSSALARTREHAQRQART